jgi:hypothetical protein
MVDMDVILMPLSAMSSEILANSPGLFGAEMMKAFTALPPVRWHRLPALGASSKAGPTTDRF